MTLTWPVMAWVLLLVPVALGLAWLGARRRRRAAAAVADPHLLPRLAPEAARRGRRVTTTFQLAAMALLLVAATRPVASLTLPTNAATVVLAVDVSRSMLADDVQPTRLARARELAVRFVQAAPSTTRVGLVAFSDVASPLVPPTTERADLLRALDELEPAQNTSLTAAVLTAVRAMPDREGVPLPELLGGPSTVPLDDAGADRPPTEGLPPARVLLFSDGGDNVSIAPALPPELALDLAARFAADQAVAIHTVALGRDGGAVTEVDGQLYFIPFDPAPLRRLAELSGGQVIDSTDDEAVRGIYRELGTAIRWEAMTTEVSVLFAAGGAVLLLLAGASSLGWQRRVP